MARLVERLKGWWRYPVPGAPDLLARHGSGGPVFLYGYVLMALLVLSLGYLTAIDLRRAWAWAAEDSLIEYLTAVFFALAAVALFYAAARAPQWFPQRCLYLLAAAGFLFIAGEEISWGQRWLERAGLEFSVGWNEQSESNLHNALALNPILSQDTLAKDTTLLFCLAVFVGMVLRRDTFFGIPLPSLPVLAGFLLALLYDETDSVLPTHLLTDFSLSGPQALLLLLLLYGGIARQGRLFCIAGTTLACGEALVYVNQLHDTRRELLQHESLELLLSAAGLLYAGELVGPARRRAAAPAADSPAPAALRVKGLQVVKRLMAAVLPGSPWALAGFFIVIASALLVVLTYGIGRMETAYAAAAAQSIAAGESGEPLARGGFEVYRRDNRLLYVSDGQHCARHQAGDSRPALLHITPANPEDLPRSRREYGYENRDFRFHWYPIWPARGGRCLTLVSLPGYPIAEIRTGQYEPFGERLWEGRLLLETGEYQAAYAAATAGPPALRADFDVYLTGHAVTYIKEPCEAADLAGMFILHPFPVNPGDLPEWRQGQEFDNLDFQFDLRGARFDGKCVAAIPLPDYPIDRLRVGQWLPEKNRRLWQGEIPVGR